MKQSLVFKALAVSLCLISIGAYGQKQSKNYSEKFNVADDKQIEKQTRHPKIKKKTWNKNQMAIEATVELEGATPEEAKDYLENGGIKIMGNSNQVSVATGSGNEWTFRSAGNLENLHIEIPELPEFESFEMDFDMAEMADLPPTPPVPDPNFDYEAFQKNGEKYLKEWQKNFQKDFGEPYQKSMEAWQRKMKAKRKEMLAKREKLLEKRMEAHAEQREKTAEARAKHAEKRAEAHENRMEFYQSRKHGDSTSPYFIQHNGRENRPNIFYFNSDDQNRNFKVKKTIKIKMPKATKIRMNVRHGEVKMAGNTINMNATLSHATLLAAVIDGDRTKVMASYSPVSVQQWNYGDLEVAYSESVELQEVFNLRLNATSSEVTIDNLTKSAFIKSDFGPLIIKSISNDFETLEVNLQNAEFNCKLPSAPFSVYADSMESKFVSPDILELETVKNHGSIVHKGFHGHRNTDKSITVHSKYSEVVLE